MSKSFQYVGTLKVYRRDKVIHNRRFWGKKELHRILEEFKGLEMTVMIDDDQIEKPGKWQLKKK